MRTQTTGLWAAAIVAMAAVALGASALREPGARDAPRATWVEDQTTTTTTGAPHRAEAGVRRVQPPDEAPAPATTATPGSSAPERPIPQGSGTAGPPVSYTDDDGDPNWLAATAGLSEPAFDILYVDWAPASSVDEQRRGYATSITIAGAA